MVDTFHPLHAITKAAMELDDDRYPYSWLPPGATRGDEARELARARARRRSRLSHGCGRRSVSLAGGTSAAVRPRGPCRR